MYIHRYAYSSYNIYESNDYEPLYYVYDNSGKLLDIFYDASMIKHTYNLSSFVFRGLLFKEGYTMDDIKLKDCFIAGDIIYLNKCKKHVSKDEAIYLFDLFEKDKICFKNSKRIYTRAEVEETW